MRSGKARPDVHVELMLDSDGSWTSASKGNARRLDLTKERVREIRVRVGTRTWWSLDVESAETARAALLEDIVAQASKLGVDFEGLRAALRSNLDWTEDECLALALAFTFPSPIVWDRARIRVRNPGAGRPPVVDATWHALVRLARAWAAVTSTEPGTGPNALFVTAVEAAAPFLKLGDRGKASGNLRKLLERDRNKLRGKEVRWLFPAPRSRLTPANFTTSKPDKTRKK